MANPRGDVITTLAGKEVRLRLDIGALAEIETKAGLSFNEILDTLRERKVGAFSMAIVVLGAISKAGDNPLSEAEICRLSAEEAYRAIGLAGKANDGDADAGDDDAAGDADAEKKA